MDRADEDLHDARRYAGDDTLPGLREAYTLGWLSARLRAAYDEIDALRAELGRARRQIAGRP